MIEARLLAAAGVDPDLPAAQQAALLVRRMPLRWQGPGGSRDLATVLESRWFAGAAECHRVLGQLFRGNTGRGTAFGVAWPYLEAAGRVLAPALPVAVGDGEESGPDGSYQRAGRTVFREAAGERRPVLELGASISAEDSGFDLMWFGAAERYLVAAGTLEIEDLFSVLRMAVPKGRLEAWLVRAMRVDSGVLGGLVLNASARRPELEVRRPAELVSGGRTPTAMELLERRAGVRGVRRRGDEITVTMEERGRLVFDVADDRDGWRVFLRDGDFPYRALSLRRPDGHVRLAATLAEGLDPLAPGVRVQAAFDLRSDLIALG